MGQLTLLEMMRLGMTNKEILTSTTGISSSSISKKRNDFIRAGKLEAKFKNLFLRKTGDTRLRSSIFKVTDMNTTKKELGETAKKVLALVLEGKKNSEVSKALNINSSSVSAHFNTLRDRGLMPERSTAIKTTIKSAAPIKVAQPQITATGDMLLIINGLTVKIQKGGKDVFIGKDKLIVNF